MNKIQLITGFVFLLILSGTVAKGQQEYLSPTRITVHPVTNEANILLSTVPAVAVVDMETERLTATYPLKFIPSDICFSADGKNLYITEYAANGKLHILSAANHQIVQSISTGAYPAAVCVNRQGTRAWVANRFSNDLSVIDLTKQKEIIRLPMIREPKSLALSPDEKWVAVGNFLPGQSALDKWVSAEVSLVDAVSDRIAAHIPLGDGAQSIKDVCFSKQGDYLFVTHLLSHYQMPTIQLDRGWMNTNALSVINIPAKKYETAVLLDDMYLGAANPCGMALSEDGNKLFVAISGTHELISLSLPTMLEKIKHATTQADIANNLTFLNGDKTRIPLSGKGARYVTVHNKKIFVTDYFSAGLSVVDVDSPENKRFISLGKEPEPDEIRRGEQYFEDAELCFQRWQSCVSCHPDVRADGLNWDLANDGFGNPKNTKSLLYAHVTPPCMITGIRKNAEIAVRAGIRYIQFASRTEEEAVCIDKYLRSLAGLPSPYLENGKLSKKAQSGKKIFEQAGCSGCHNGAYLTDGQKYNVGTGIDEYTDVPFDTPTLKEIWRTTPYLYNGSAKTIHEVITTFNANDKHGATSKLTEKELEALEQYILSL
jgi:DNA-binding beta-propeller fold protein YncE